jgi:hypothetical protein
MRNAIIDEMELVEEVNKIGITTQELSAQDKS